MARKKYISNAMIVAVSAVVLLAVGITGFIFMQPEADGTVSQWLKNNFFPANAQATTSILDTSENIAEAPYQGSTTGAWVFCVIAFLVSLGIGYIIFAKERGIL